MLTRLRSLLEVCSNMKTTFKVTDLLQGRQMKYKTPISKPSWSSLPQHKKEEKFMDVLTNGYPNDPYDDNENRFGPIPQTYEVAETPTERIIRIKKRKVKCYDVFRQGYSNV